MNADVVIFQSPQVSPIQRAFRLLDTLGYWLPVTPAALLALGVVVAGNSRLAVLGAGAGLALSMVVAASPSRWRGRDTSERCRRPCSHPRPRRRSSTRRAFPARSYGVGALAIAAAVLLAVANLRLLLRR